MKRDMDLIRNLMIAFESGTKEIDTTNQKTIELLSADYSTYNNQEFSEILEHHLDLLEEAGLATFDRCVGGETLLISISWDGHDFLDSLRDQEIWNQTKDGANKAGAFTFDILLALGKGFIKKKIEDHTGISVEI